MNVLDSRFGDNEILITKNGILQTLASAMMTTCAMTGKGPREQVARTLWGTRKDRSVKLAIVERGACWKATRGDDESLMRIINA